MPIYVWKCTNCETVVEELRKMDDTHSPECCGECGKSEFKQQITAANFKIDPAAGRSKNYKAPKKDDDDKD